MTSNFALGDKNVSIYMEIWSYILDPHAYIYIYIYIYTHTGVQESITGSVYLVLGW